MKRLITLILTLAILASFAFAVPSNWAAEEIELASAEGLITPATAEDFQAAITREQFCELVVKLYEKLTNSTATPADDVFLDTDNTEILKAYGLGITNGTSNDTFSPDNFITRQEICVMLTRCIKIAIEGADVTVFNDNNFLDKAQIADWARDSVNYAYDNGIMKGTAENVISPLGNTTCEQAIILSYRIFANRDQLEVAPEITQIGEYSEELALVQVGEKYGFVDRDGNIVIACDYDWAESFSEGLAMVRKGNWDSGRCGFIDRSGKTVIPLQFEEARSFSEGYAPFRTGGWSEGKYGYIDKSGNVVIKAQFDMVGDFRQGIAVVRVGNAEGSKYGYIDTEGNYLIEPIFDYASDFENGEAFVFVLDENGGESYKINTQGQRI